jgi:hypothetical protein
MFNYLNNEKRKWKSINTSKGYNSSEDYVFSYICSLLSDVCKADFIKKTQIIKRGIFIHMNIFFKIAAGIVGGVAIIASLGGFNKNSEKKSESRIEESDEIPDEIFDGNIDYNPQKKGESIQRKTEQNVRNLQEGLSKASNVLGHISIICNSIVKMFYEDPCIRTNPSTIIC